MPGGEEARAITRRHAGRETPIERPHLGELRRLGIEAGLQAREIRRAEGSRLQIRVKDGRLFWGGSNEPLAVHESGAYTYLSSATEPGRYVRLSRLNDRLTYVEHVDKSDRSVTFWGELRIVLGSTRR